MATALNTTVESALKILAYPQKVQRLARMYNGDSGYTKNPIRLISCETGKNVNGFAQNLANKLGREVIAPSDTVWIHPSGKMTIGPNARSNTGKWISFYPRKVGN